MFEPYLKHLSGKQNGKVLEIEALYRFEDKFWGFDGHFPGNHILPAVIQLMLVKHAMENFCQRAFTTKKVLKAKFKNIVLPEESLRLRLRASLLEEGYEVSFRILKVEPKEALAAVGEILLVEFNP